MADKAPAKKKFNLAIDPDVTAWLNYEAARRDLSVTAYINQALREARDNAPANVKKNFEAFMATREA